MKPKPAKTLIAWAEVAPDGSYSVYDRCPTRTGIAGNMLSGNRAVKVKITPVKPKGKNASN